MAYVPPGREPRLYGVTWGLLFDMTDAEIRAKLRAQSGEEVSTQDASAELVRRQTHKLVVATWWLVGLTCGLIVSAVVLAFLTYALLVRH